MNGTSRGITQRALAAVTMLILALGTAIIGLVGTAGSASAEPRDKDMICHPVNGLGETKAGWNLISPDKASSHLDEENGNAPKHTSNDGLRSDTLLGDDLLCPGEDENPVLCPEDTDKAGEEIPEGEGNDWCDEEEEPTLCPAETDKEGEAIPEGEDESWCDEEEEPNLCPEGTDKAGDEVPEGEDPVLFCDDEELGIEECPDGSPLPETDVNGDGRVDFRDCAASGDGDGDGDGGNPGGDGDAEVLGIEANAPAAGAPAAAPTAVDAGVIADQSGTDTSSWLLAGAALALMGAALGLTPARARGKRAR